MINEQTDFLKIIRENSKICQNEELCDLTENYPFADKEAEVTVTFVSPILTGDYIYKMVYPALALNAYSTTHKAYMVGIHDYIAANSVNDYATQLPETFIKESNYIVFPFMTYDLRDVFDNVRAYNPDVKIAYCVDYSFLRVPVGYPNYKAYESRASKDTIIENMRAADIILVSQVNLGRFLFNELKDRLQGANTTIQVMPAGFFPEITERAIRAEMPKVDESKFRVGIIANATHFDDISCIREQLIELKEKHRDNLEIISYGWKGQADFGKGLRDVYRSIPFKFERPCNFYGYNTRLAELQLDCLLIPVKLTEDHLFTHTGKNYRKYIEASAMGIPCIVTASDPYKDCLYPGDGEPILMNDTAILIEKKAEWVSVLNEAIGERNAEFTRLDTIAQNAYVQAHQRFSYKDIVGTIEEIFE